LVNNNTNNNLAINQSSVQSEDLSVFTNYSDDTYIHNENEPNLSKGNSKLCEEINQMRPIVHSETEIHSEAKERLENLFKAQSVQYPLNIKPFHYSYDSLDRDMKSSSSVNVMEPLDIDENTNEMPSDKYFSVVKSNEKLNREIVTANPEFNKNHNLKKYFPTHSYDQVVHPPSDFERRDSYCDYDPSDPSQSLDRKFSEMSLWSETREPSTLSTNGCSTTDCSTNECSNNGCDIVRSRAIIVSNANTPSKQASVESGSTVTGSDSIKTTSTESHPSHSHILPHHHHFFVISNSEADIPTTSQLKYNSEFFNKERDNCSSRVVISSRQHRKFDITTSPISTKTPSLATMKTGSISTHSLLKHRRTPSNSSNVSTHSRFTVIRESSKSVNNDKTSISTSSTTPKKHSRFTVTRQSINSNNNN